MKIAIGTLSVKHTEDFMSYLYGIYLDINHQNVDINRLRSVSNLILKVTNTADLSFCYIFFVVFSFFFFCFLGQKILPEVAKM